MTTNPSSKPMRRASKICPECRDPHRAGSSLCPDCHTQKRRKQDRQRPTAAQRGYDAHWRRTRAAYLANHPRCEQPGCGLPAVDVNHLDGLGPRGPRGHDFTNLEALCHPHHSQHTARAQPGGWNARPSTDTVT
jgi:5-methylcytosine-specific restriction enzyme A